ncbi:MAG: oligosaccharide flippase family protein [Prevotella sp.]|nr:oligosaccharide flippase family protein [Prevotella sp.]
MVITQQKKQVVMLYASTLTGVFLGVLSSIVNTRFLAPADYGDVRYVQNIINFVTTFLLFGYFLSGARLMALSNDRDYVGRVKGMMIVILAGACVVIALAMPINSLLHADQPQVAWLFLLSIPVCFSPLFHNYIDQTAQGDNQIGLLSLARLLPYLVYVPIGYLVYSTYGATSNKMVLLQWGIYTAVYLVIIIATKPLFRHLKPVWKDLNDENKRYGIQLYIGSLVMVSTNYLAGISLGYFNEDNSEVGFYTLALTVTTPLAALPAIVGTTYFKKFATQPAIPKKVIIATVGLTFTSCILFILLIHPVVEFLYTDSYAIVGTYASILSVGYCIHGLGDMFNRYLCSHGQGASVRNASIANGVFKLLGYTLLVWLFNTNGAIATTIICDVVYFSCLIYYYVRFTKQPVHE